jgi:lysophospholipid acyltransferase (LPLAT)-like uncharacterized protein
MPADAKEPKSYADLKWHERLLLTLLSLLLRLWTRTLRYHFAPNARAFVENQPAPSVIVLWHNRLFAGPTFFRRFFKNRRMATLISASSDGAWPAAFVRKMGMLPIRGSHHRRGSQAVREMLFAHTQGYDIAVTPDGSRGPLYEPKPGAIAVALKTGAPIILFSLNFSRAWRLKSWDRFYVPVPFSRVEAQVECIERPAELSDDPKELAALVKARMDAITVDL